MSDQPWAEQLRPLNLDEFVGQSHLTGSGKPLRVAIDKKHKFSFILWGPPGVGKTTLARIYAGSLGAKFVYLSAVAAGKDDVRKVVTQARELTVPTVLFLDEIHRFNKAQQDFLLPYVEDGTVTLIGATTENPSFEVISPLLSRCRVFTLTELAEDELKLLGRRTAEKMKIKAEEEALDWAANFANGDGRQMIGLLEATYNLYKTISIEKFKLALQSKHLRYDKAGEEHYNVISAFIKSMRAGDPDAAVYYLARMVEAGEDPLFIARRMVIFASEDIGLAQPTALVVANAVFRAVETIGYPECAINLAHGATYLAGAKKDRRAYDALRSAQKDVRESGNLPVPLNLRNAATEMMKGWGYGRGYEKYPDKNQSLLPEVLGKKKYLASKIEAADSAT